MCVCVCKICACMCVGELVCPCSCLCIHVVAMPLHVCLYPCSCLHACLCSCLCMHIVLFMLLCPCVHVVSLHAYLCIHVHASLHACLYVHAHASACVVCPCTLTCPQVCSLGPNSCRCPCVASWWSVSTCPHGGSQVQPTRDLKALGAFHQEEVSGIKTTSAFLFSSSDKALFFFSIFPHTGEAEPAAECDRPETARPRGLGTAGWGGAGRRGGWGPPSSPTKTSTGQGHQARARPQRSCFLGTHLTPLQTYLGDVGGH